MDPIAEWTAARRRVGELLTAVEPARLQELVPSCPQWTVRDLLSHMIGLDADVVDGDEPDDHNSDWTQRQVDDRRQHGLTELLTEWEQLAGPLTDWMRDNGARPLGDVIIHEQDLRGALGVSGGQDSAGLAAVRAQMADRFGQQVQDLPAIRLSGPGWSWSSRDEEPAVRIEADDFELARALMSRRSADQLRSWTRAGDVEPFLAAFAGLGPLPDRPLAE